NVTTRGSGRCAAAAVLVLNCRARQTERVTTRDALALHNAPCAEDHIAGQSSEDVTQSEKSTPARVLKERRETAPQSAPLQHVTRLPPRGVGAERPPAVGRSR